MCKFKVVFLVLLLCPASLVAQGQGTVSAGGGSGAPGSAVNIPVTLNLNAGTTVETLTFGVEIVANGPAPALTGMLSFTKDSSLPAPNLVDTGAGPNLIAVAWLSPPFAPPLSGMKSLGVITMTIPITAQNGQSYTVRVTGASATLGDSVVTLTPGPNVAVNVVVPPGGGGRRRGQLISE